MYGAPSLNTTSFRGVHCPSCWKKMPSWTFCVLSFCSCSLGHVGPSCHPHMFPMFHLIETSPVRQIQNCRMWMALGNESPTFKSLRGNKSTQLLYGQITLIHPVDQHLVKATRNFKTWSFQALQCQLAITQLKKFLSGRLVSRPWRSIAKMYACNTTCMTWNSIVILNIYK